jgi:hypothetical protein
MGIKNEDAFKRSWFLRTMTIRLVGTMLLRSDLENGIRRVLYMKLLDSGFRPRDES